MGKNHEDNKDEKKWGVLIGGSGLIGGHLLHYFKTVTEGKIDLRVPNSKKVSLRNPQDIINYIGKSKTDFIINSAITPIDSNAQISYDVNYLGSIHLAKVALRLNIPYIHLSSAATLPEGENLVEEDRLPLEAGLPNYAKSKIMSELTLKHMHEEYGLDFTGIRLGIAYGKHDYKIQGIHRLLFSIMNRAMPFYMTQKNAFHSYSNARKIPELIHHILKNREEFSGEIYHFVDKEPIALAELISAMKKETKMNLPRNIFVPLTLAKLGKRITKKFLDSFARLGVDARLPAEIMFLEKFYTTQTLSAAKLNRTSYQGLETNESIYTVLPQLVEYYSARWDRLNLFSAGSQSARLTTEIAREFLENPIKLVEQTHKRELR